MDILNTDKNKIIKVLVLVPDYPTRESHALMYVHNRNKYYLKNNILPTVLNFSAKEEYEYDGIRVIPYSAYKKCNEDFDLLICHAPNIRNHYEFLKRYKNRFRKIIFVFHGHEILKLSETYPAEYVWAKTARRTLLGDIYDDYKVALWRKFLKNNSEKIYMIFVSNWLYYRFLYYVHLNPKYLAGKVSIINNAAGEVFEQKCYDFSAPKKYDFITIRGNSLDGSKYGIDLVCKLAENNPKNKFLIIGRGSYFKHNTIPKNVEYIDASLTHDEMLKYVDESRCALLLTRQDTQGVMACEMITYGIPLITSNIEICREMFDDVDGVRYIDNDKIDEANLSLILKDLCDGKMKKTEKFFSDNTTKKEVDLIKACGGKCI